MPTSEMTTALRSVICPRCGVDRGQPCMNRNGVSITYVHQDRFYKAWDVQAVTYDMLRRDQAARDQRKREREQAHG